LLEIRRLKTYYINLFVELDKGVYIKLDIRWCGKKKTLSLGKDFQKVEVIVKRIDPSFNRKINKTNYKFIGASIKKHLDDFLIVNGFKRFCGDERIVWSECMSSKKVDDLVVESFVV